MWTHGSVSNPRAMWDDPLRKLLHDLVSFLFLLGSILAIFVVQLTVVIPDVDPDNRYIHTGIGVFILANILLNLMKTVNTDTSTHSIIMPSGALQAPWHYCFSCESNAPPRSYHCLKCRTCVLKRDHHCIFACHCIGLKNFRFFLMFLLYMWIGALYATILNVFYVWPLLGGFTLFSVAAHVVPFLFFFLGSLTAWEAISALLSMLCISGFMFIFNLYMLYTYQMLKNQTTFERNHKIVDYNLGWRQNLVESLGNRWYLVGIFPLIKSVVPSDGLTYAMRDDSITKLK